MSTEAQCVAKCTGDMYWEDNSHRGKATFERGKILRASVWATQNKITKLVIDYDYDNGGFDIPSADGINFKGNYTEDNDHGAAEFKLYQNSEGYALLGKFTDANGYTGNWLIELAKDLTVSF